MTRKTLDHAVHGYLYEREMHELSGKFGSECEAKPYASVIPPPNGDLARLWNTCSEIFYSGISPGQPRPPAPPGPPRPPGPPAPPGPPRPPAPPAQSSRPAKRPRVSAQQQPFPSLRSVLYSGATLPTVTPYMHPTTARSIRPSARFNPTFSASPSLTRVMNVSSGLSLGRGINVSAGLTRALSVSLRPTLTLSASVTSTLGASVPPTLAPGPSGVQHFPTEAILTSASRLGQGQNINLDDFDLVIDYAPPAETVSAEHLANLANVTLPYQDDDDDLDLSDLFGDDH